MVSWDIDVGGALPLSAMKALHASFFDVARIRATCQRELPAYKQPVHYEVVDQFPLTSGHKIDRAALTLLIPPILTPTAPAVPLRPHETAESAQVAVAQFEGKSVE